MQPFDASDYRRRVLAAVHTRGSADDSDPFEIYDIPLDEVDRLNDKQVAARVREVWAFWQKSRDHPRYRGVVLSLLAVHEQASAVLATKASRVELRDRVRAGRDARDSERFAEVDAAAGRLVQRFGGLPEDKLAGLRALAAARGVEEADFELRIRRFRRLPAGSSERSPRVAVGPDVLRQVRADLDELGRITGNPAPRSLFGLLGADPTTPRARIRTLRDELAARNRQRRPDRRRALVDDLLAAVTALLVDGDPEGYLDAIAVTVKDLLRPKVAAAVLVEDELTAADAAVLVTEAETEGLDPARARAVVAALATEHGVSAPQPAASSTSPPSSPRPATSSRSAHGAPTPYDAPTVPPTHRSSRPAPAPSPTPSRSGAPSWGTNPPVPHRPPQAPPRPVPASQWQSALSRARAALRAGRPTEASDEVRRARETAGEMLPQIRAVSDDVERVLREAATAWRALVGSVAARRFVEATAAAEQLARTASDVPGPDRRAVADVLTQCRDQLARADELVARAGSASGTAREDLIAQALALVADNDGAARLLHQAGVRPPGPVSAARDSAAGTVVVSWQASATGGEVRYRVRRLLPDGAARTVGSTTGLSLEDGGAPGDGPLPTYEVAAGRSGVWSAPVRWSPDAPPPVTVAPDTGPPVSVPPVSVPPAVVPPAVVVPATTPEPVPAASPEPALEASSRPAPAPRPSPVPVPVPAAAAPTGPDVEAFETPDATRVVVRSAADTLAPASGMHVAGDRLRWTWPAGCTEMMVAWRSDAPPFSADDPAAQARKVTNTRYEIDGGVPVPGLRPLHVAVFACVRANGALVVAAVAAPSARLHLVPSG